MTTESTLMNNKVVHLNVYTNETYENKVLNIIF